MLWDWLWNIQMAIGKREKGYTILLGLPFEWWAEFRIPEWLFNKLDEGWNRRIKRTFQGG